MIITDTIHDPNVVYCMLDVFLAFRRPVQRLMNGQSAKLYTGYLELNRDSLRCSKALAPVELHSDNLDKLLSLWSIMLE